MIYQRDVSIKKKSIKKLTNRSFGYNNFSISSNCRNTEPKNKRTTHHHTRLELQKKSTSIMNGPSSRQNVYSRANPTRSASVSSTGSSSSSYRSSPRTPGSNPTSSYANPPSHSYNVQSSPNQSGQYYSSNGGGINNSRKPYVAYQMDQTAVSRNNSATFKESYQTDQNALLRRKPATSRKSGGGGGKCRSWMYTFCVFLTICALGGYSVISYRERESIKAQLAEQEASISELEITLSMKFETQIKELKTENSVLTSKVEEGRKLELLNKHLVEHNKAVEKQLHNAKEEIKSTMQKHELAINSKATLQANIQKTSKDAVLAKFGKGPHRLEMYVRFDSHLGRVDGGSIIIELAPIDELPHTVYWFLEQVDRKLYDGFSFHRNAGHVLQGVASVPNFLTSKDHPANDQRFRDAGFHSLLFLEYSEKFPHLKYTLGFAGNGGPSFYINTKNNSKIHGPGGQKHRDDPNEADTCFAKVIDGFDVVDRMFNLPVKEQGLLKDVVAIERIRRK